MDLADMVETDVHDDGELSEAERERVAEDVLKVIGDVIARSPGVSTESRAGIVLQRLTPEQCDSVVNGGSAGHVLAELVTLVMVEETTRRVDE
jgi:hypothetical protein